VPDGTHREEEVADYAPAVPALKVVALLPDYFVDAQVLSPEDVVMQATVQKHVDS
jgi:hypothetical protein